MEERLPIVPVTGLQKSRTGSTRWSFTDTSCRSWSSAVICYFSVWPSDPGSVFAVTALGTLRFHDVLWITAVGPKNPERGSPSNSRMAECLGGLSNTGRRNRRAATNLSALSISARRMSERQSSNAFVPHDQGITEHHHHVYREIVPIWRRLISSRLGECLRWLLTYRLEPEGGGEMSAFRTLVEPAVDRVWYSLVEGQSRR
jgi:hypothetical protein